MLAEADHLHAFKYHCDRHDCQECGTVLHCFYCGITISEFREGEDRKDAQHEAQAQEA